MFSMFGKGELGANMEDRCPTTASPVTMQNWVHKRSAAQVLVRAIRTSTTSMATLDVHWSPDIDAVFRCLGAYSPLIVIETVRQSVIATAHHLLGVELGTAFMMREIDVEFLGFASIRDVSEEGVSLTVEVECAARIRNTQHWTIRIRVDDSDVARATGISMLAVQPLYARLRGGRAHKLIESVKVEANRSLSSRGRDGCLGRLGGVPVLHVDQDHPVFFDHPLDHVPGLLVIEAALQVPLIGEFAVRFPIARVVAAFSTFIELDVPCYVTWNDDDYGWHATFTQGTETKSVVRVDLGGAPMAGQG
ncbi:AfsA-related hotdog domain-containing protein [Yimella lutea]|nr:AfsA-related hotdog domain-containing protein [Yimella lutea]